MGIIEELEQELVREDLPQINPGDTVRVHVKVVEGNRERIQVFEGTVLRLGNRRRRRTITVRRVTAGIGVERTFPLDSPKIEKIEVTRRGRVRRARLYYLRERIGKKSKVREKREQTEGS